MNALGSTVFPTKQLRYEAVEKYQAIEGGQQTLAVRTAGMTLRQTIR
jgi:hypothetical protein